MAGTRKTIALFVLVLSIAAHPALRGAAVPFTTLEAENATLGAGASLNSDAVIKVASSEKGYVHLNATGEYVQFNNLPAANRLVLRYSIPQNSGGTISLYLNGVHRQDVPLTSTQCYDEANTAYVRRYNEVSVAIAISAGDSVKLQKDAGDICSWYGIDLIDMESAPAPLNMPANFLSIAGYGATGNDSLDDTPAIKACISAAAAQGKGVWIPSGFFCQNTRITLPANVDLKGAGMWYSTLHNTVPGTTFSNDIGFTLASGTTVSDLRLTGVSRARGIASILFRSMGNNDTLQNLWIQNVGCVHGWEGATPVFNIVIRNSRVIGTYFDGVHWGDGTAYHNLVENVFFRGLGDDAIAQVNRQDSPLCYGNIARFNTVVASYWGRGLTDIGGDSLTLTDNIVSSCYAAGLMIATEVLTPSLSRPVQGLQFLRNTIRKCGHTGHNHGGIHVWLNQSPMKNVVIKDNLIEYGETKGIRIDNTTFGDAGGRTLFENNISRCNAQQNYDNASDDIFPTLTNNDFSGCTPVEVESHGGKMTAPLLSSQQLTILPNPFRSATTLLYDVRKSGKALLTVHDILGRRLAVLANEEKLSGTYRVTWDAQAYPAGIYIARLQTGGSVYHRALVLR